MEEATGRLASVWTTVAGLRVHARVSVSSVPANTAPIVLVHGLGMSSRYLMPTARCLAADHRVYVPELPGHGRSEHPPEALDVPALADSLAAWVRVAGPARAAYLGNSLGCQVIVDFALRYPEHIDAAILIGPSMDPEAPTVVQQGWRGVRDMLHEPLSFWPVLVGDYFRSGPVRTLRTLAYGLRDPVLEKLPRVPVPTLILRGQLDPIAPQGWAERMVRLLPRARLVVLPGAAHVANYSAPEGVARAVRSFLGEELPPRPQADGPVGAAAGQRLAVGRERQAVNGADVPVEGTRLAPR
jgi:2-hydroxy-6-oxonona-2,4-dienedioate hydrolase